MQVELVRYITVIFYKKYSQNLEMTALTGMSRILICNMLLFSGCWERKWWYCWSDTFKDRNAEKAKSEGDQVFRFSGNHREDKWCRVSSLSSLLCGVTLKVCVCWGRGGGVEDISKKKYEIIQSFRVFQALLVYIKVNIVCD